jgi:glutamate-ammonia-ligase adenylyltransferase
MAESDAQQTAPPPATGRAGGRRTDAPLQTAETVLARLGLEASTAEPVLRSLGVWGEHGPLDGVWPVVEAVATAPSPAVALDGLARFAEARPEAWAGLVAGDGGSGPHPVVARAAALASGAPSLVEVLIDQPEALADLAGELEPWVAAKVHRRGRDAIAGLAGTDDVADALAALQRHGLVRVAARDALGLADTPTAAAELAELAEGVFATALDAVRDELGLAVRVAVVAMGKLGGRELNYVSDVDVMFVHDGHQTEANKVAERFMRLLGEQTRLGAVYEVDPNLRPEGRDGPLSRSLKAFDSYYERWAARWELQALLKARPVAGDVELGQQFTELAARYAWPDRLDGSAVGEIQAMKHTVESSAPVQRDGQRQVKLAPGGLRDIEFAVQLLQLVHGRHDEALRSPNTLTALTALADGGYVDDGDANLFDDAYQFLRTVEHRLQLTRLRRTHTVPEDDDSRAELARAVGFRDIRASTALQQFDAELRRVQGHVRRLHEKLFYRPLLSRFAELGADDQVAVGDGAEARLAEQSAGERLAALGFADPQGALSHLDALASGVSRRAKLFRTLLPALLPSLADTPDPDGGLAGFRHLADHLGGEPALLHSMRDNPPVGEALAEVLGKSQRVGEWLRRQPEVVSALSDLSELERCRGADEYRRQALGVLRRAESEAAAAEAVRRLRRREAARTAIRDLTHRAEVGDVAAELTGLAEACLEAAVALVVPEGVRLAVIGMGKVGGGELGYASDLDVILVAEPAEQQPATERAVGRLLEVLSGITPEGQAFQVDLKLRPEGSDGPLVRTLDSYRAYYERWAQVWELQALTRARPVAGDHELGAALLAQEAHLVYPESVPEERLAEVRQMKARVEAERAGGRRRTKPRGSRGTSGAGLDLKLGEGGLSDIEWTVQLLAMAHGGRIPALRVPGTLAALDACEAAELLGPEDAGWLRQGWRLLTSARNAVYLSGGRHPDRLPAGEREAEHIAGILGYDRPGQQALTEDLRRAMRRIRKVHERTFSP